MLSKSYLILLAQSIDQLSTEPSNLHHPQQQQSQIISKQDFLTEEGYWSWVDQFGKDSSLIPLLRDIVLAWDVSKPLNVSAPHKGYQNGDRSANKNDLDARLPIEPRYETTMNLVLGVIEAINLPKDHRSRDRTCYARVEYGKNSDSVPICYETQPLGPSSSPKWNQKVTLTIKNLVDVITISVMRVKEGGGFFYDNKDELVGVVTLNLVDLVTEAFKSKYYAASLPLKKPTPNGKSAPDSTTALGEISIEIEMSAIVENLRTGKKQQELSKDRVDDMELEVGKVFLHSAFGDGVFALSF